MKNEMELLRHLKKHGIQNKKELIEKFGNLTISEAKYYDDIEDCGTDDIQITLKGKEKLANHQQNRHVLWIAFLTLLVAVITLLAQLFQLHF